MDVGCRPRGRRRLSVKRVDGTAPLILSWLRGPPCHLKGREPGSLLECGKLKTMLPDLACLISRGPGHTAQPRPPSQPSLSSVLTACRHLRPDHDQPVELLHLKGQWRGLGSESLRQACGVPPAQSKSGGGSPKPEVTRGPTPKGGQLSSKKGSRGGRAGS